MIVDCHDQSTMTLDRFDSFTLNDDDDDDDDDNIKESDQSLPIVRCDREAQTAISDFDLDSYDDSNSNQSSSFSQDSEPLKDDSTIGKKDVVDNQSYPFIQIKESMKTSTPNDSIQSIKIQCEKCNEMLHLGSSLIDELTLDKNLMDSNAISMPKIIKSDSGISVERRQNDHLDHHHNHHHHHHHHHHAKENGDKNGSFQSTEFEAVPLSDESECSCSSASLRSSRSFFSKKSFLTNQEIKAALKMINENLLTADKNFFSQTKSVEILKKFWFRISSSVDSDHHAVESFLDFIEKYYTKLMTFIVNLQDDNENTALHYAISYNNFDIVSVLLDSKKCDVNRFNKAGYTATMLVSLAKIESELYRDIVERLFNQADVNLRAKQNGQTALMLAASHGRVEISKILMDYGADINLQDNDGSTALMCAAEHGHAEVISLLLSQSDCDPSIEDNEGSTALKIALINGHNEIGVLLYAGSRNLSNTLNSQNRILRSGGRKSGYHFFGSSTFISDSQYPSPKSSPKKTRRSSISNILLTETIN
ncbi:ankyrin repeat domain containing protein 34 [Sarcoptes scabiei]|uniref:Ankyrin repeat domain containing protein 34 n=1 Tax=Sarcoptes scabiei TaxID=52283 RepID=A0A132AHN7_SARSC|nr:ankyrin repeat domain containing protein 34 [Sarcoptes scabiei]